MSLASSVYDRWNNAGLNVSIAPIYPGGDDDDGTPEDETLPRAQYTLGEDSDDGLGHAFRMYMTTVTLQVWGTLAETVDGYLDAIDAAMVNSEDAATNPMVLSSSYGVIIQVKLSGRTRFKEDDGVWRGVVRLDIRWYKSNTTPS